MSGFPVHSNGQTTINFWFYNGIQERDGTILLIVIHCKFYGRVNTIDVLKEVIFVNFLVDDKGVIYKPVARTWGVGDST